MGGRRRAWYPTAAQEDAPLPTFFRCEIVTRTHPHTGNLAICRRAFPRFTYGEVKQRKEIEDIGKCRVQTVVVDCVVVSYFIEAGDC